MAIVPLNLTTIMHICTDISGVYVDDTFSSYQESSDAGLFREGSSEYTSVDPEYTVLNSDSDTDYVIEPGSIEIVH